MRVVEKIDVRDWTNFLKSYFPHHIIQKLLIFLIPLELNPVYLIQFL